MTKEQADDLITKIYLYGSARYSQGVAVGSSQSIGPVTDRMAARWDEVQAMIRELVDGGEWTP